MISSQTPLILAPSQSIVSRSGHSIEVTRLELIDYLTMYEAMTRFVEERDVSTPDQICLLQHPAVYTQGTACKMQTLLPSDIPIVKTDRGGQITYHGPGQIIMYPLLTLKRYKLGVKGLVHALEQAVIDTLTSYGVTSVRRDDAPGVYVENAKIAALGLRIRRGSSYHGLSLNVDMDLLPFANIDPCGFQGLQVTQLSEFVEMPELNMVGNDLLTHFLAQI